MSHEPQSGDSDDRFAHRRVSPAAFTLASGQFAAQEGSSRWAVDPSTSSSKLTVKHVPDFLRSLFTLCDCGSMRKAGNQESSVVSFHKCESELMFRANRFPHSARTTNCTEGRGVVFLQINVHRASSVISTVLAQSAIVLVLRAQPGTRTRNRMGQ